MKYARLILTLLLATSCNRDDSSYFDYKNNPKPLSKSNRFFVISLIVAPTLNSDALECSFIQKLKEIGLVYTDQSLTEQQKKISYFESATLQFKLGNIGEITNNNNIFPVIAASLSVHEGVEILRNHSKTVSTIWKSDQFFADDEHVQERALTVLNALVHNFAEDYKKANPNQQPIFYLSPATTSLYH